MAAEEDGTESRKQNKKAVQFKLTKLKNWDFWKAVQHGVALLKTAFLFQPRTKYKMTAHS